MLIGEGHHLISINLKTWLSAFHVQFHLSSFIFTFKSFSDSPWTASEPPSATRTPRSSTLSVNQPEYHRVDVLKPRPETVSLLSQSSFLSVSFIVAFIFLPKCPTKIRYSVSFVLKVSFRRVLLKVKSLGTESYAEFGFFWGQKKFCDLPKRNSVELEHWTW